MKLNKVTLSLVLLSGLVAGASFAAQPSITTPKSDKGAEIDPLYGGYKATYIADLAEQVVCSGRCLLADVIMTTGPRTSQVAIKDTSVANGTGKLMIPVRTFDGETSARTSLLRPIRSVNGITIKLNAVSQGEGVTILYLDSL